MSRDRGHLKNAFACEWINTCCLLVFVFVYNSVDVKAIIREHFLAQDIFFYQHDLPDQHPLLDATDIAVDTEAMGLEFHRDRLCLVQLSKGDGVAHLVQITQGQEPPHNVLALLRNPKITKIFHFARFDVGLIQKTFDVMTAPIFCTKIASKLVRTYTDRHGLKDLCRDILKVEISKQEQTSDWGAPSLTDAQKHYAATDVLHLHELKHHFETVLMREKRLDLARAAFDYLPYRALLDVLAGEKYDILAY